MTLSASAALAAASCFAASALCAAVLDLTTMRIRNDLVLFLLAVYAALAPLAGIGWGEIGMSALVASGVLAVMFGLFAMGWIGGGDAKLAAVAALWLGAGNVLPFVFWTALAGGVLTFLLLQFRTIPIPEAWLGIPWVARLHAATSGVPYGVAIAAGALAAFPETAWIRILT